MDPVFWIYFDQQRHVVGVLEMKGVLGEKFLMFWGSCYRRLECIMLADKGSGVREEGFQTTEKR